MAIEFVDMSVLDLVNTNEFLHHVNPSLIDKFVFGIEKARPGDQNVVFHLIDLRASGKDKRLDKTTFILSAQYIIDHEYWQKNSRE